MANSLRLIQFLIAFKTHIYVGHFLRKGLSLPFDFAVGVHFDHMSRWHKTHVLENYSTLTVFFWPGRTSERQSTPIGAGWTGKAWYDFFLPHHVTWKWFHFCHMESFVTWKCQIYFLRPPYNMMPDKTFHFLLPIVISLKRNCAHLNARNKACFLLKSKIMKRAEKSEVRDETNLSQPQDFCLSDSVSQFVTTCINLSHHRVSSCRRCFSIPSKWELGTNTMFPGVWHANTQIRIVTIQLVTPRLVFKVLLELLFIRAWRKATHSPLSLLKQGCLWSWENFKSCLPRTKGDF